MRLHCEDSIKEKIGTNFNIKQANFSHTVEKGSIRGMHFQKPPALESKIVRCIEGRILDVAVDLRPDSPTFKKWVGFELSEDNKHMLYVPEGFGHGFSVLSDEAEVQYSCTNEYSPDLDAGIRYDDPELNINWHVEDPVISDKDEKLPTLAKYLELNS